MHDSSCPICAQLNEQTGFDAVDGRMRHLTELMREVLSRLPESGQPGV